MKTYKASEWKRSDRAWIEGDFSSEWDPWRVLARTEGTILFPPEGSKWDSWEDDSPSQRAMLVRAMRETPDLLRQSLRGSRSWGQVIERILRERDDRRRSREDPEPFRGPSREEATESIRNILERIR